MTTLTIVIPYYKNVNTLEYQLKIWKEYPSDIEVILVDDGSPIGFKAEDVIKRNGIPANFKLYRILTDLPWNIAQARNIGMFNAVSKWGIWLDIDHIIPPETIKSILNWELNDSYIYSFGRIHHVTKVAENPHKEIHMMLTKSYIDLKGFDESFAGHYSFAETNLMRRLKQRFIIKPLPFSLERISQSCINDCKTVGLTRKKGRDDIAFDEIIKWKADNDIGIENLKLPWKRVI